MINITIGNYLINRLKEINIDVVFGVPGDFNMPLLDIIEDDPDITWGNNANELNASYAADGYARIRGVGALITTFGVGELSALNGIAGSYSEMVPVIHIVGTPSTKLQDTKTEVHHSLGDGGFDTFFQMSSAVSCASTRLTLENAVEEIDRVISKAILSKRPGYIAIPIDLINSEKKVPKSLIPLPTHPFKDDLESQNIVLNMILKKLSSAKHPIIIVDGCVTRRGIQKITQDFIERSGLPAYVTAMAKGSVNESIAEYRGCFIGNASSKAVRNEVRKADLVLRIGYVKSDVNTGNFSNSLNCIETIELHSRYAVISGAKYPKVSMMEIIPLLTKALPENKRKLNMSPRLKLRPKKKNGILTSEYFWSKVPEFIEKNAIVCADMGTAAFATLNMDAPDNTTFVSQMLWCSIGYSIGAAVGAAIADRSRQVYLFVGDGSFQVACQEISIFIRHKLTPVIFLLNNNGYLMEKMMNGPTRSYNNIKSWNYRKTLDYFGAHIEDDHCKMGRSKVGYEGRVQSYDEFEQAMKQVKRNNDKIHFIEVILPQFEAPNTLELLVEEFKKPKHII
ncbi:pyruvate decarboxylase PdcB [Sporodiniella umbellata]|nr:pyruvate decarboxylase PdcB [Sporodiniella umbellata]